MLKLNIIGLCGPAGSGKDTVAKILHSQHGFERLALADPIKEMASALYIKVGSPPSAWIEHPNKEAKHPILGVSYRAIAQTIGTEWAQETLGRTDLWTSIAHHRMTNLIGQGATRIVITDIRMPHEATWLSTIRGSKLWTVQRQNNPHQTQTRPHITECGNIKSQKIIANNGTLNDLQTIVAAALKEQK